MSILKRLKTLDWPTLMAELVLIFVGITAALWFDNRNEAAQDRLQEIEVLSELSVALESDTVDLNFNLRSSARTLSSIDTVLAYLEGGLPYDPLLDQHFRQLTLATAFIQNSGAYEYLKSTGLGVIRDDDLRRGIVQYYEVDAQLLRGIEDGAVQRQWQDDLWPQMMSKFEYQFFFEPAVPHDYDALTQDRSFRTSLRTKIGIMGWKDGETRDVLEHAEGLLDQIRMRLAQQSS